VKINPWILMAAAFLLLTAAVPRGLDRELYDAGCALIIFPAFAYLATAVEPGPKAAKAFAWAGGMSYALYLIHAPLGGVLKTVFLEFGRSKGSMVLGRAMDFGPPKGSAALGLTFVAGAAVLAWLAETYYDRPVRRWLNSLGSRPPQTAAREPVAASTPAGGAPG
jgi:peptidoglycan/LPS O-acetylase OafA/YrhL